MIVQRENFQEIVQKLARVGEYGLDTETTGLRISDRVFSVIFSDADGGYYFNFQRYENLEDKWILPKDWIKSFSLILENKASVFFIHNAKFDMGMLAKEGLKILGAVHCTEAMERVLKNNIFGHKPYSLASCALRRGLKKDDAVDEYIKKHKLTTKLKAEGKDKEITLKHFDRVPWEIITKYGEIDAILTREIGLSQLKALKKLDDEAPVGMPKLMDIVENERKLTKTCFRMEQIGVPINRAYCQEALSYTQQVATSAMRGFEELTGIPFEDSPTVFKKAFEKLGVSLPVTATGKPCTKKEVLEELDNPIAEKIREIRGLQKLCSTYYSSFLYFADRNDVIHPNMRQGGTETSRFSYSDPNLQNLPKEKDDADKKYLVRRCFVPGGSDWCFVPIDYSQQEFRMMLDYAGETDMIDKILEGMDVHTATAELLSITRDQAKTINFGLLYGMGVGKLAKSLKVPLAEASDLRNLYFSRLPKIELFIRGAMSTAMKRGYVRTWNGFRSYLDDQAFAYILPNHIIQGGCGQVLRQAMVAIDELIREKNLKSQMILQVHDELLFRVHRSELEVVEDFKRIMETTYRPKNRMRLDCAVEHSWVSFAKADQVKGMPKGS